MRTKLWTSLCNETSCANTATCIQDCNIGQCSQMICKNSTKCEQDCWAGLCRVMKCEDDVKICKQRGDIGSQLHCSADSCDQTCDGDNCTLACSGKMCEQTCNSLINHCNMSCSADVEHCAQTCLVHCASANCKLDCLHGSCWLCEAGKCHPTSTGTSLVMVPSFICLAFLLVFFF